MPKVCLLHWHFDIESVPDPFAVRPFVLYDLQLSKSRPSTKSFPQVHNEFMSSVRTIIPDCDTDIQKTVLRMYCIDRAGVPETHDAHAFHCLYD